MPHGMRPGLDPAELLKAKRMRVTAQRRLVLGFFLETAGSHWSADGVRSRLLPKIPELARGTTYKVLNELVKQQLLEEIATADGTLLYGLRLTPHHHFFCERCRTWYDVSAVGVDQLRVVQGVEIPEVTAIDVIFRGICNACRAVERSHQA